ncbi:myb-like protein P [Leptopilina heterotoma]|uniref:myb-like protein P n=1 Tax=Leptopilina heterotoma TaxID=63436 RepID=UPI001CA7EB84|nr:myb-like protein P [Leptopilina heterotoma]
MTNRMLWLLSYVGLGLALALGNRPVSIEKDQKGNQKHEKMVDNMNSVDGNTLHLRSYQHDVPLRNNMYLYDGQSETINNNNINNNKNPSHSPTSVFNNERIMKPLNYKNKWLDNLYSTVLDIMHQNDDVEGRHDNDDNGVIPYEETPFFWQQEQQQQQQQQQQLQQQHNGMRKLPDIWERRGPENDVYDYVEGPFVKNRFNRDNRISDRSDVAKSSSMSFNNESEDLPEESTDSSLTVRERGDETGSMNLEDDKSPGMMRSRISTTNREARGVSKRHKQNLPSLPPNIASQVMLRSSRGNRQYDVPQIECPASEDGMERFACPTPDRMGRYRCIDDHVLCDGFIDCPTGEDEDRQACMFYKTIKAHLDVLADAVLRWARGR